MERKLPSIEIEGTEFIIDVNRLQLREKENEENVISISDMQGLENGYLFDYSYKLKNLPALFEQANIEVFIPDFVVLDPIGMAEKYNLPPEDILHKTDFDLMVDQQTYDLRVRRGMLPTVEIEEHTFFVDLRMDKLRPKDDFGSRGIIFSEIEDYFNDTTSSYIIPYDPKKKEVGQIDYDSILRIPKDLIVIEIPCETSLDKIGWNRIHGYDLKDGLKEKGLVMNFKAKRSNWEAIYVPQKIRENVDRIEEKSGFSKQKSANKAQKRRRPKM